eukprot:TRINITY_DN8101_c0_g1_i2.p1 TRINITY_DN8101_c0_g1~~TRINITY_DN8101_c0_g1_i2.p1  ORF type:complete len:195 (-),score=28.04 TRINITY_DN8101_c0_g1_i2:59-643(-)
MTDLFDVSIDLREVPEFLPLTLQQEKEWSQYWPIVIKRQPPTTPNTDTLSELEVVKIFELMQIAKELAVEAKKNGNKCNGCVIVDKGWSIVGEGGDNCTRCLLDHSVMECLNKISAKGIQFHEEHYLCTGFYAFCWKEPCVMCAMALLHSRIGKVFFHLPNQKRGGLVSRFKIHCQSSLNHHFHVYRVDHLEDS